MPIPGNYSGRMPVVYKVSIGEVASHRYKTYPQKLDHFKIKRRSPEGGRHWVTDEQAQKALEEGFCDWQGRQWDGYGPKPQRVPIVLFSDNISDVLVSGLAWYGRNRRYCWATGFAGVEWEDERAPAYCEVPRYGKPDNMSESEWSAIRAYHCAKHHLCKPLTCPNYSSEGGYKCKRFAVLRFILPFAPTVTGVAEFRTTGKASCIALENSLRRFQAELQGMLAGVPLLLCMQPYQVTTPDGIAQTQWEVRLDYPAELSRFRALAAEAMERRKLEEGRLREIATTYRILPAWEGETAEDVTAHAREFAPEAQDLPEVDQRARFEGYADSLGWLPGQKAAVLQKFEGDLAAAADYAQEEFERHGEEQRAPMDLSPQELAVDAESEAEDDSTAKAQEPQEQSEEQPQGAAEEESPNFQERAAAIAARYEAARSAEEDPSKLPTCNRCDLILIHKIGKGPHAGKTWWECPRRAEGECDFALTERQYLYEKRRLERSAD
jgi:hypothetical protein